MARLYASKIETGQSAISPLQPLESAPGMSKHGKSKSAWFGGLLKLPLQDLVAELKVQSLLGSRYFHA